MCLGDNHCQTIENQRTAIAQLRERLSELELAKPPGKYFVLPLWMDFLQCNKYSCKSSSNIEGALTCPS